MWKMAFSSTILESIASCLEADCRQLVSSAIITLHLNVLIFLMLTKSLTTLHQSRFANTFTSYFQLFYRFVLANCVLNLAIMELSW